MRSREVQQYLASITGRPIGEIDQRARPIREAMKIPTGPRGLHAPHMKLEDGMLHILTLPSRRVGDAGDVALKLARLNLVPHPVHPDLSEAFKGGGRQLMFWLIIGMRNGFQSAGFDFKSFELFETGDFAVLNFDRRSLRNIQFLFSCHEGHWDAEPEDRVEIYDTVLRMAAASFSVRQPPSLSGLGK